MFSLLQTNPILYILNLVGILLALSFHEFSHAFTAYKLGDNTAKERGRLTLNPLAHIDLMGFIFMMFAGFGWAKPVPVDPSKIKNKQGLIFVSAAGPLANVFLAIISLFSIKLLLMLNIISTDKLMGSPAGTFLISFVFINIALFIFNLLPIWPLDGSKIFLDLFINENNWSFKETFIKMGPFLLLGFVLFSRYVPIFYYIYNFVYEFLIKIIF